jgi:hypothetical protein
MSRLQAGRRGGASALCGYTGRSALLPGVRASWPGRPAAAVCVQGRRAGGQRAAPEDDAGADAGAGADAVPPLQHGAVEEPARCSRAGQRAPPAGQQQRQRQAGGGAMCLGWACAPAGRHLAQCTMGSAAATFQKSCGVCRKAALGLSRQPPGACASCGQWPRGKGGLQSWHASRLPARLVYTHSCTLPSRISSPRCQPASPPARRSGPGCAAGSLGAPPCRSPAPSESRRGCT